MASKYILGILALVCPLAICKAQNSPQDFLKPHNEAREVVGVGPLLWDNTVAAYASSYAWRRIGDCQLEHSGGSTYGENIFWGSDASFTALDAVRLWVDEKPYYDYKSNACLDGQECLHYTQVVWKDSVRLGCARVECHNGQVFITCNYDPPGNFEGRRPY